MFDGEWACRFLLALCGRLGGGRNMHITKGIDREMDVADGMGRYELVTTILMRYASDVANTLHRWNFICGRS